MNKLNERDIDELHSIQYEMKSVYLRSDAPTHHLLAPLLKLEKFYEKMLQENKKIEDENFCDAISLDEIKEFTVKFVSRMFEEIEKRQEKED